MEIRTKITDGIAILELIGPLVFVQRRKFKEAIAQAAAQGPSYVLVDIRAVNYIDSAGLAILVLASRDLTAKRIQFAVIGATGSVASTLRIAELPAVMLICADEQEAFRAFRARLAELRRSSEVPHENDLSL